LTTVLDERTSESTRPLTLELAEEDLEALRSEYERLSRDANPALAWNRFLHGCVAIGLDRLQRISALEVFELIDRLEG
jgi:hypothetical protein